MTYIPNELRQQVAVRANSRCEYCHLHEDHTYFTHEIDHIYAEKHGGKTELINLSYACSDCNRYKGSDLCSLDPESQEVVALFHPRNLKWNDHFTLNENGIIEPKTATGRVTVRILRLNRLELITDRARLIALGEYKGYS